MPTHGSPAAARQANARARPRAGVSRPAHRPRPAQPSAPAPVQDPALKPPRTQTPIHTLAPPFTWGRCLPLQGPPSAAPRDLCKCQSGHVPGLAPRGAPGPVSAALLPEVPCWVQGGKAASLSPHLLLALKQLAPAPGFPLGLCSAGPSPHSGSGSTASHPRDPLLKQPPVHCPGTCWPCSPVLDSQLLLLLGTALSFASFVRICLLCWIVSPMN